MKIHYIADNIQHSIILDFETGEEFYDMLEKIQNCFQNSQIIDPDSVQLTLAYNW